MMSDSGTLSVHLSIFLSLDLSLSLCCIVHRLLILIVFRCLSFSGYHEEHYDVSFKRCFCLCDDVVVSCECVCVCVSVAA